MEVSGLLWPLPFLSLVQQLSTSTESCLELSFFHNIHGIKADEKQIEQINDATKAWNRAPLTINKTGLQPVSRPVEPVHGAKMCSKND